MRSNPYQDNYGEVRKVNSRKPIIPLDYKYKHKGIPAEIIVDPEDRKLYYVDDYYNLIEIGGQNNINIIKKQVILTQSNNAVSIGTEITDDMALFVYENGAALKEGRNYNVVGDHIEKINGNWNADLEEIVFDFVIYNNLRASGSDDDSGELLPQNGTNGQILIKTSSGMAWADVDITDDQYDEIIGNTLGTSYLSDEEVIHTSQKSIKVPSKFPTGGISGQALTRTATGMVWADVDITETQYTDMVTNTIGTKYVVNLLSLLDAIDNADDNTATDIPIELPQDGSIGQVLFKTDAGTEWKDLEITNTTYRNIIANTLGDKYVE